jgi:hypothetical protein
LPNTLPFNIVPESIGPVVRHVQNGVLQLVKNGDDFFHVAHLSGSPYEMGYAHGSLLRDDIQALVPKMLAHFHDSKYWS